MAGASLLTLLDDLASVLDDVAIMTVGIEALGCMAAAKRILPRRRPAG
jgi:predicted DNA repair protein MutK